MRFEKLDTAKTSEVESKIFYKNVLILEVMVKNGYFMMDQFMLTLSQEFIMFLLKLLKMLFVNIKLCKGIRLIEK